MVSIRFASHRENRISMHANNERADPYAHLCRLRAFIVHPLESMIPKFALSSLTLKAQITIADDSF